MNIGNKKYIFFQIAVFILLTGSYSCRRLIEVNAPPTSTNADVVFSTDATAIAIMTGIYAKMNTAAMVGINSLSAYPELSADNLELFPINDPKFALYFKNMLSSASSVVGPSYWNVFYEMIYNTNIIIEKAPTATKLNSEVKDRLLGEAYFMRAFGYFYLVNLFGNVPLVLTTDYNESAQLGRTDTTIVMQQVIADLKMAQLLLKENYVDASLMTTTQDRLRPNKLAATALLARAYLYSGDYVNAEAQSTIVINKTDLYGIIPLNEIFLKNSKETIWALQPIRAGENTPEAKFYKLPATGPNINSSPTYLSERLLLSFDLNDNRKDEWVDSVTVLGEIYPYPMKYRAISVNGPVEEFSIVLRLAEQYLIRAEARTQQNNLANAKADLSVTRLRSGLDSATATNKEEMLTAILNERRLELFTEWGHRWFDLKRTGKINIVMESATAEKGGTWKSDWQLYPIPVIEIQKNINLRQNNGYN